MSFTRTATSVVAALITVLLATATLFWLSVGEAASAGTGGLLEVGTTQYQFEPSACAVADTDFVVAGRGTADGESFWVSASSRGVSLTVGTSSELERPTEDDLRLISIGTAEWTDDGGTLSIETVMQDARNRTVAPKPATLVVSCLPAG